MHRLRVSGVAALAVLAVLAIVLPATAASGGASNWKASTYNPSGRALSSKVATTGSGIVASFAFPATPDAALLTTDHGSYKGTLLGDLTGKTLSAGWSSTGATYTYYGQPDACDSPLSPSPAAVRLFFSSTGGKFAETQYWWAHGSGASLLTTHGGTLTASLADPSLWSDFYGHSDSAAFASAVANVTSVGLSFGGGCFFENGVGAPNRGSFTLASFGAS